MSYRSSGTDRRRSRASARASACLAIVLTVAIAHAAPPPFQAASSPSALVELQRTVDRILAGPALDRSYWGVLVKSLTTGETVYSLNPGKLLMPASTLKVVTLAAAAERLGWDYAYETRIVADGLTDRDTIDGNLVIVGSGDPSLTEATLDSWAAGIKSLGIRKISGTVLVDARLFKGPGLGPGWSWDDLAYYYAAPVAAAQYRENAVDLVVRPGASAGQPPLLQLTPAAVSGLRVENRMTTGPRNAPSEFAARRAADSPVVILEGVVPSGSRPVSHALSVPDPVRFLAAAFAEALLSSGVELGATPAGTFNPDPLRDYANTRPLLVHRSDPLRLLARRFMGVSQNLYGETLLKTLGVQAGDASFEGGIKAVESILSAWQIPGDGAVLRDGSGLSRYNYVTADTLVRVLTRMYDDPLHRDSFFSSLTVAGRTGTLTDRMKNTAAAGNAVAKDGAMAGVRALCGVVYGADREPLVFAILANNFATPAPTVNAAIDALVAQLAGFKR